MSKNETVKNKGLFASPYYVLMVLILGMFMTGLDSWVLAPALVPLVNDLHTSFDLAAWVYVVFMLLQAILMPLGGKMSDVIGRKKVLIAGIAIFTLGSLLSAISWNIYALIAFRAIQAMGAGIILPTVYVTMGSAAPPEQMGKFMGALGSVMGLSMILGPNIGGYVVQHFGWRAVFYVNIPIGILAILLALTLKENYGNRDQHMDLAGSVLLGAGLGALLLGINQLGDHPLTDITVFPLFLAAVLFGLALYWYEKRTPEPILDMSIITRGTFLSLNMAFMVFSFGMSFAVAYAASFAQIKLGMGVQASGTIMTPMSVGVLVMSVLGGMILDRFGFRPALLAGGVITAAGIASMAFFVNDSLSMAASLALIGMGIGTTMGTFEVAMMQITPAAEQGVSMGILNMFESMGGVLSPVIGGFILNDAVQGTLTYGQAFRYIFGAGVLALLVSIGLMLYFNVRSRKISVQVAPVAVAHQ